MKLLSVVVPSYNSQAYLKNCIESLLAGGDRMEIIIVDDGSTDDTGRIADEFAAANPGIVTVIHQENGGHGEGVNQGILHASGTFFKIVDSDDCLSDDLPAFLDLLEGKAAESDLVLNNFVYSYQDENTSKVMDYHGLIPAGVLQGWDAIKKFPLKKYLMIHSCTFRTEIVRKSGIVLPKHVFYEDNLYLCGVLPFTEKIYYADMNLYFYTIGREGQSISDEACVRRFKHHLQIADASFRTCRLEDIKKKNKRLYQLQFHQIRMIFGIASNFTRYSKDPEADKLLKDLWRSAYAYDKTYARKLRHSTVWIFNLPGRSGRVISHAAHHLAHKIAKFN